MIKKHLSGFTLIELMVTMSIAGILMAIAVPSLQQIIINRTADRLIQELQIDLLYARNQAISQNQAVNFKAISADNWHIGWTIEQQDNNGIILVLRQKGSVASPIAQVGEITSSFSDQIDFDRLGRATSTGTFTVNVPKCKGDRVRTINIRSIGQITTGAVACP